MGDLFLLNSNLIRFSNKTNPFLHIWGCSGCWMNSPPGEHLFKYYILSLEKTVTKCRPLLVHIVYIRLYNGLQTIFRQVIFMQCILGQDFLNWIVFHLKEQLMLLGTTLTFKTGNTLFDCFRLTASGEVKLMFWLSMVWIVQISWL